MRSARNILAATALLTLATACSQEAEAPANEAAAVDANMMAADPSNPYAQAEMQMKERMAAAQGSNPSETWTRKMIEHHRGAIAMSDILLAQGGDPQVLEKARMTADKQRREIAELEALLPAGAAAGAPPAEGANPFAKAVQQMHQQMMAAGGANPSETWLRKMIVHHRGGVDMSNVLLDLGGDPRVIEKARMTARDQAREADELERMLSGEPQPEAVPEEGAASEQPVPPPTRKAAPTPPPAPKAKAETPKEAAADDPHAGHDMNNMSH